MIGNRIKSFLAYHDLPFQIVKSETFGNYLKVTDNTNTTYLCGVYSLEEYATYLELIKYSNNLKKAIYDYQINDKVILFFDYEDLTENKAKAIKIIKILQEIHSKSSFEITLKKEHLSGLNNLYKVLDNKFAYFEMRIREIEMSPIKNDVSWIILSKYNIILDAKLYLYDLQQDIFKYIDKSEVIKYGFVYKNISLEAYNHGKLLPALNVYYAPISMVYCRAALSLEELDIGKDIEKLDIFNQKYFCFMMLYVYILNLNLEITLNNYSVSNYLLITQKIKSFITKYKTIIEK